MSLKLSEFERNLIQEISTLSGHQPALVREIMEFVFLRQAEEYYESNVISIPFMGKVEVKYMGDTYVSGGKLANIETLFHPSNLLKKIVGEVEDENSGVIEDLVTSKIKDAMQNILQDE